MNTRCERCMAEEGKKHPTANFIVKLNRINIEDTVKYLCIKCAAREQARMQKKEYEDRGFSLQQFFEEIWHKITSPLKY